ncbi:hypothetical protein BLOT_016626 [Blomia tropicalis]|nr:hypothetical protein BLOT_016626 [Blomia tropicalis]
MMGKNDKNWKVFQCMFKNIRCFGDITLTELLSAKCFAHHKLNVKKKEFIEYIDGSLNHLSLMLFLTNHGNFNAYLHKINKTNNAACGCGDNLEDAKHVLLHCVLYNEFRNNNIYNLQEFIIFFSD